MFTGNLAANVQRMQKHLQDLREICRARGIDGETARKKHGKINVREICQRFKIEKAYLVDYAWWSGHVHEKNIATSHFYSEGPGSRVFQMGPIQTGIPAAIGDTLRNMLLVLETASRIVDDEKMISRSESLVEALREKTLEIRRTEEEDSNV